MRTFIISLVPVLENVLNNVITDEIAQKKAKEKLFFELVSREKELELASENIRFEGESKHFLAANWRPITMLTFLGLIVARWFGLCNPDLSEAEYLKLWSIVEIGLGGYTIGRSAEKIVPKIVESMKK